MHLAIPALLFLFYLPVNRFLVAFLPGHVRFYINSFLFYLLLIILTFLGSVFGLVAWPLGYGSLTVAVTGRFLRFFIFITIGIKVHQEGRENLRNRVAIIVANHQTEADMFVFGGVMPRACSVLAKKSLQKVPAFGWWLMIIGTIFIDKNNRAGAITALRDAAIKLKLNPKYVWIFPEGRRSYLGTPTLLPFKKGAFHLAIESGMDIVPIVSCNYSHVISWQERRFEAGDIIVKVLPPIETRLLSSDNCDELTQQTNDLMAAEYVALTERVRSKQ